MRSHRGARRWPGGGRRHAGVHPPGLDATTTVTFTDTGLDVSDLRHLPGVERVDRHGVEVHVAGTGPVLAHVGAHLVAIDRPPLDLRAELPSLEDGFVALTTGRGAQ